MTLEDYKSWYIHDEGHWYVSKVKQFNPIAIQEFAKGLAVIDSVINASHGSELFNNYQQFKMSIDKYNDRILINDYSIMYICLHFLKNGLISSDHLQSINKKKFKIFSHIQKEFIEGKDYEYFIKKYTKEYLTKELLIYYRNFKSWLGKFGFYGEYENRTAYITEMGHEFIVNKEDKKITSAIFLHQIKKYQLWNPTIIEEYRDYKIRPYFLLLEVLNKLPGKYFTKNEYALFITKLKSHQPKDIDEKIDLIKNFRALGPEKQKEYIAEIVALDKKRFRQRTRSNYDRLHDSAGKEISCYGYGGLITKGSGLNKNNYILSEIGKSEQEIATFFESTKYIEFKSKLDWISHLGSKDGLNITDIIEMYLAHGISLEQIKSQLNTTETQMLAQLEDKLYEKEIESYYVKNINEIDPNLEVLSEPAYGRQFSTHIGPIDILCIDKQTKEYVVCELKRGQTSDESVGQILRYMGWVKKHLANNSENVRGILIGSNFNDKIDYSLIGMQFPNIYNLIIKYNHPFTEKNKPYGDSVIFKNKTRKIKKYHNDKS